MLFDPGSTFSYVSTYFAAKFDMMCDSMTVPIRVSTPVGNPLVVDRCIDPVLFLWLGMTLG